MKTLETTHLGDGAYAGIDIAGHQIWIGANHHEHMTVALGPREIGYLVQWLRRVAPHIAKESGL